MAKQFGLFRRMTSKKILNFVEREIHMKLRQLKFVAGAVLLALTLSGCYVGPAPGPCYWVPGHYGPYGGWHPGHCA